MTNWSDNPELTAATYGQPPSNFSAANYGGTVSSSSSSSPSGGIGPAPGMPDISELTGLYDRIPGLFNARKIGNAFNNQINTTRSQGFQAASNAAGSYAARQQQMGVAPTAAGVVEAQARAPVYSAVNDLTKGKEEAKLQAHQMGATLQSQIAAAIGNIREGYTKTLAEYNLGAAGLRQKGTEFDQSLGFSEQQLGQSGQLDLAKILGSGAGGGKTDFIQWLMSQLGVAQGRDNGYPGYVGNTGFDPATGKYNYNNHNAATGVI